MKASSSAPAAAHVCYRKEKLESVNAFYREAGPRTAAPTAHRRLPGHRASACPASKNWQWPDSREGTSPRLPPGWPA